MKKKNLNHGSVQRLYLTDLLNAVRLFCYWHPVALFWKQPEKSILMINAYINGHIDFSLVELMALPINQEQAASLFFPPEIAAHVVKLACERPDDVGRSVSQWFCEDLARQLITEQIVENISSETIRRILANNKLKPWRVHMWLSDKYPRDATFYKTITEIINLYTRPLNKDEIVICVDEKTSLQPRLRSMPTKPALPGNRPNLQEHEYKRAGALQLFAAFDTRTGKVYGQCYDRKRQIEFISFLKYLNEKIPRSIRKIHIIADNVSVHHGKQVEKWLETHHRFIFHFTPVHCSWMNQVEQWFSILQRKRFRIIDFVSKDDLCNKIYQFIEEWNEKARPFNWSKKSVAKVMANAPENKAA
jgi:transposase